MTTNIQNYPPTPPGNIEINKLPSDIVTKIYLDNFQYDIIYDDIQRILDDDCSIRLCCDKLIEYFKKHKLIENEKCMKYICSIDDLFNRIYTTHYKDNKKDFILMKTLESMCQCWLMYLYH